MRAKDISKVWKPPITHLSDDRNPGVTLCGIKIDEWWDWAFMGGDEADYTEQYIDDGTICGCLRCAKAAKRRLERTP